MEEPISYAVSADATQLNLSATSVQENPLYSAMDESVSFGRFTSESLSWEKWSAFNRKRHVEEAEKYSKPGSVKQKKAYLEAHFKRMATVKSDQTDAIQQAPVEPNVDKPLPTDDLNELQCEQLPVVNDQLWVEKEPEIPDFGGDQDKEELVGSDEPVQIEPTGDLIDVELIKMEESSLQSSSINEENSEPALIKRNPPLSSFMPSVEADKPRVSSSSPVKPVVQPPVVHPVVELDKKRAPFYTLLNRKLGRLVSPVIKKMGISSKASKKPRLRTTPKENPNNRLCQSFCFRSKLETNSLNGGRETESPAREG